MSDTEASSGEPPPASHTVTSAVQLKLSILAGPQIHRYGSLKWRHNSAPEASHLKGLDSIM